MVPGRGGLGTPERTLPYEPVDVVGYLKGAYVPLLDGLPDLDRFRHLRILGSITWFAVRA